MSLLIPSTKRAVTNNGVLGELQLPTPKETETDSVEVYPGFTVHAGFGSIFCPKKEVVSAGHRWVPIIPYFYSGEIFNRWQQLGGSLDVDPSNIMSNADGSIVVVRADVGAVPGHAAEVEEEQSDSHEAEPVVPMAAAAAAPMAAAAAAAAEPNLSMCDKEEMSRGLIELDVLYHYDRKQHKLDQDFTEIASMIPEGCVLAFPALGVNNGVTCYESAYRMFHSVLACLTLDDNPMRKMSGIFFLTPYWNKTGLRTMQHLFNMIKVYRCTRDCEDCPMCAINKLDSILPCGHRYCQRCAIDMMKQHGSLCAYCSKKFFNIYPCYKITDCSDFDCCALRRVEPDPSTRIKAKMVFTPCGHCSVYCTECLRDGVPDGAKICPVCQEPSYGLLPVYG